MAWGGQGIGDVLCGKNSVCVLAADVLFNLDFNLKCDNKEG